MEILGASAGVYWVVFAWVEGSGGLSTVGDGRGLQTGDAGRLGWTET